MIDRARLDRIHERVVAGEPTASAELFVLVHHPIAATLRKRVGTLLSWEEACDLVTDAIVAYLKAPTKFDPARAGLFGYVLMIAKGDALNLLRDRGVNEKNRERFVELLSADGNTVEETPNVKLDAERIMAKHHRELIRDDGDEAVLRLYLDGEKETSAYATVLGLTGLPGSEQQREVKVRKDRIELRLKRLRDDLDEQ